MLRFVGCDVHKRTAVFTILLQDGAPFGTYTAPVTREALAAFAERRLGAGDRLAMEKGERVMLERKRLDAFYSELQTPSRIEANTPAPQVEEGEEDFKSELTQS